MVAKARWKAFSAEGVAVSICRAFRLRLMRDRRRASAAMVGGDDRFRGTGVAFRGRWERNGVGCWVGEGG